MKEFKDILWPSVVDGITWFRFIDAAKSVHNSKPPHPQNDTKNNFLNMCLGVFNKIETLKKNIKKDKPDVMFLQECEITKNCPVELLKLNLILL